MKLFNRCKHHYKHLKTQECDFFGQWAQIREFMANDIYYICENCGKEICIEQDVIEALKRGWKEDYAKMEITRKPTADMIQFLDPNDYAKFMLGKYFERKNMAFDQLPTCEKREPRRSLCPCDFY